jgi:4-alpha-glucanotransferase
MECSRSSGILLHFSSLPGKLPSGDLGPGARHFIERLAEAGQSWWQVLPVGPTGYGHSPYQSLSTFAGNPSLISMEDLCAERLLSTRDLESILTQAGPDQSTQAGSATQADHAATATIQRQIWPIVWQRFRAGLGGRELSVDYDEFRHRESPWLVDYALFQVIRQVHGEAAWTSWPRELAQRDPSALSHWAEKYALDVEREHFIQFCFQRQWSHLKTFANQHGVRLLGDIPIFMAHDSADVWAKPELFELTSEGHPRVVAGVPPDYFCEAGQLWGNPLYAWPVHKQSNYAWWTERLGRMMSLFDLVRIDHFRGFAAYWEIPAGAPTAVKGRWVPGPGTELFRHAESRLGSLPLVAEDLGLITPDVQALRHELGFPGMCVLQFAFGAEESSSYHLPYRYCQHSVAYTGTHDNDTTWGWFHEPQKTTQSQAEILDERHRALRYFGTNGENIHLDFIDAIWKSTARIAIAPFQDLLGLGSKARMNTPGSATGNWTWRLTDAQLNSPWPIWLRELSEACGRC